MLRDKKLEKDNDTTEGRPHCREWMLVRNSYDLTHFTVDNTRMPETIAADFDNGLKDVVWANKPDWEKQVLIGELPNPVLLRMMVKPGTVALKTRLLIKALL